MDNKNITTFSHLKRMVESLEHTMGPRKDMDITFEYVIASLFPTVYDNIIDRLRSEHLKGYMDAVADCKDLTLDEIYDKINIENQKNIEAVKHRTKKERGR